MGLIDGATMQTDARTDKIKLLELDLSDMVISSVQEMKVLTLHRDYFRLSRPIERRVYEIARKSVGQNASWMFKMSTLHHKSGSKGSIREFRRQIKPIVEGDYLPDYMISYDSDADMVTFINRNSMPRDTDVIERDAQSIIIRVSPDAIHAARSIAVGWDIHFVLQRFGAWWLKIGKPSTHNTDALFLKFCHTWQEKKGRPS